MQPLPILVTFSIPVPGVLCILVGVQLSRMSPPSPVSWECGILLGQDLWPQGLCPPRTSIWLPQLQHNPVPALGLLRAQGTSQFCSGSLGRCLLKIRPWLEPAAHPSCWFPHPKFAVLWQKFPSHNHCFPCHGCHVRNYQTSEGKKKNPTDGKLDVASNCKVSLGTFWLE